MTERKALARTASVRPRYGLMLPAELGVVSITYPVPAQVDSRP